MAKAKLFLRGKTWWGRFPQGKGVKPTFESLGTQSADLAQDLFRERERQLAFKLKHGIDIEGTRKKQTMTLAAAFDRYWDEYVVVEELPSANKIKMYSERAEAFFGTTQPLAAVDLPLMRQYKAHLAKQYKLGAWSTRAHLLHISIICNHARKIWQCDAPHLALDEKTRILPRKPERPPRTIRNMDEQRAITDAAAATDLLPIFRFCQLAGVRKDNARTLTKQQVDWHEGVIRVQQKGNRLHEIVLTNAIADVLRSVWEDHPEHVFTFVCRKNGIRNREARRVGRRYPFSNSTLHNRWDEVRALAGTDVLWHPATRAYRVTQLRRHDKDIARKVAGHSSEAMSAWYDRAGTDELRAMLDQVDEALATQNQHTPNRPTLEKRRETTS